MNAVDASVIVCTYNRAHLVGQVLDDLLEQEVPEDLRWEIVVVDNNSSDRTREILEAYLRNHPHRIRNLFEGRQGKSFALNAALAATEGEFLLFTDDDVQVERGWVASIVDFLREHPAVFGVGGRVRPILPGDTASPLHPDEIARYFSFDFGEAATALTQNPFGANMAYRRTAFTRYGNFRTDLGPTGEEPSGLGEDSEFGRRILDDGQELWYLPSATIHHPVQPDEITPQHLDRWHFSYGRALVRRTGIPQPTKEIFSVPRFLFRSLAEAWLAWVCSPTPRVRRHRHWQLQKVHGQIYEARRILQVSESTGVAADESPGHGS